MEEMIEKLRSISTTTLWWGGRVSTIFTMIDNSFGEGVPLIFETKVFSRGSFDHIDLARYSTEQEARLGHKRMVRQWMNPFLVAWKLACVAWESPPYRH